MCYFVLIIIFCFVQLCILFLLHVHACVILTGYLVSDISFSTFHLLFNVDLIITDMYES